MAKHTEVGYSQRVRLEWVEHAARLALERALFSKRDDTGWFATDYVRPTIAAVRPLLEEAMAQGEIRPSNPFFLFASFAGACLFFAVAGPSLGSVFGVKEITPELRLAFTDYLLDLFRQGLASGPGRSLVALPHRIGGRAFWPSAFGVALSSNPPLKWHCEAGEAVGFVRDAQIIKKHLNH